MDESVYVRSLNGPLTWVVALVAVVLGWAALSQLDSSGVAYAALTGVIFLIALSCLFIRVRIAVSDEVVEIKSYGVSYKIPLDTVSGVQVGPQTGLKEGAGPRFIGNAAACLVPGPSVRIEAGSASYIASANDPEEVVADIEKRIGG